MGEAERQILDATLSAVSQYGMRRTSMNDIAERAGVSRQTVYNTFGTKDEIYRAAIIHLGQLWEFKARQQIKQTSTLADQLDAVFGVFSIEAFKISRRNKDADDMLEDAEIIVQDAVKSFHAIACNLYKELFRPFEKIIQNKGMSVDGLAEQVESASRGYKSDAHSIEHLKELLNIQKVLVLTTLESG